MKEDEQNWLICIVIILAVYALSGCAPSKRDQAVIDSAATIWEAAEAQLQGVDVKLTAHAIQCEASAICAAHGVAYPPHPPETTK